MCLCSSFFPHIQRFRWDLLCDMRPNTRWDLHILYTVNAVSGVYLCYVYAQLVCISTKEKNAQLAIDYYVYLYFFFTTFSIFPWENILLKAHHLLFQSMMGVLGPWQVPSVRGCSFWLLYKGRRMCTSFQMVEAWIKRLMVCRKGCKLSIVSSSCILQSNLSQTSFDSIKY